MIASTTDMGKTLDGLDQFQHRWVPDGPPRAAMLMVHGIGEHAGRYEHVGAAFAAVGIDVLAHDQRGFGRSGGPRSHVDSFEEYLTDIEPLIADRRALGVPVILLGHSLGGLVTCTYLVSNRPQPDLAVLSAPAFEAEVAGWQRAAAPVVGVLIPRLRIPIGFDPTVLSRDVQVQQEYRDDPLRVPSPSARLGSEILRAMETAKTAIGRLRIPIYVFHGTDDGLVPLSASEPLESLPNVTRRVWPGLRHECFNEPEQDDVITEIIEWLDCRLAEPPTAPDDA